MAYDQGSEFYGLFSNYNATFKNVIIYNPAPVSSMYCDTISFQAYNLTIMNNIGQANTGGGIACYSCGSFNVDRSVFTNLKAKQGGAIYLEQVDSAKIGATYPYFSVRLKLQ